MSAKLDLKYRPQLFRDLIGQPAPAHYLSRLASAGKARIVVLEGPTGCGKTSAGRLYGRALNCLDLQAEGEPCNVCQHCTLQAEDRFPDYREQDAGSEGGKEATLRLLESARTPPLHGRFRVVVIDEAHNLSRAALETAKKLVEEPPPFLALAFVTTKPGMIIQDIRDRCARLKFRRIPAADGVAHLQRVCEAENLPFEPRALELIAHLAEGSLRPLMTRLDQISDFGEVSLEHARMLFNLGFIEHLPRFWTSLLQDSLPEALSSLAAWDDDPEQIVTIWREFMLWLQCRAAAQGDVIVNPMFAALPAGAVRAVVDALGERARAARISLDDAMAALSRGLGLGPVPNRLLLQLLTRDLHNLIHLQDFDVTRLGAPASAPAQASNSGPVGKAPGGRRRQFAPQYLASKDGVAYLPDDVPSAPSAPGFQLAPAVAASGVPTFGPPPTMPFAPPPAMQTNPAAPPLAGRAPSPVPTATVSIASADDLPPVPSVEDEKLPTDAVGGEFPFKMPELPARRPVFASDLAMSGWREGPSPQTIFHDGKK